jgi:hypothetical protein
MASSSVFSVAFLRVGKRRLEIFHKACNKFGLNIVDCTTDNVLILIDDELDLVSACKTIQRSSTSTLVRTQWLSDSIKQNQLLSHHSYIVQTLYPSRSILPSCTQMCTSSNRLEPSTRQQMCVKRERSTSSNTDDESNAKGVSDLHLHV